MTRGFLGDTRRTWGKRLIVFLTLLNIMQESFLNDNLELETIPKSAGVFV